MNKTIKIKTALILALLGIIIVSNIQEKRHQAILKRLEIFKATLSAEDSQTGTKLNPAIIYHSSSKSPSPHGMTTSSTGKGNEMVCEWIGVDSREIQISSKGYSTQSVVIATQSTNIVASLTKLEK